MSAGPFQKTFRPVPPAKGAFPLDHFGECVEFKDAFLNCLKSNKQNSSACRQEAKEYLSCRMDKNLMAKEPMETLGLNTVKILLPAGEMASPAGQGAENLQEPPPAAEVEPENLQDLAVAGPQAENPAKPSEAEPKAASEPKFPKTPLEDPIKPDPDTDFKWPTSPQGECWNLFLHGTSAHLVKPSYVNNWTVDFEAVCSLFGDVITDENGIQLVNTIARVFDRKLGIVKESLIFGLAYCSCSDEANVKSKAFQLMPKVCATSKSFLIFIDFREKIHRHLKETTGWSHALRTAVKKWYQRYSPIEMARIIMECPRHNKWTHKDVLALTHLAPRTNAEKILFSYITCGKRTLSVGKNGDDDDESQGILKFLEDVATVRAAKNASDIVLLMDKLQLSWNFVPISLYRQAELWEQMISEMPIEIMIENTTRMAKLKLLEGNSRTKQTFISRCEDKCEIEAAGIQPFAIFAQKETYRDAIADVKRKPKWTRDPEISSALQTALAVSVESNLKSTGKRYFIAIDASDSMKAHIYNYDRVQCRLAAAFLTLCINQVEVKVIVKAFGLDFHDINITPTTTAEDIAKTLDDIPLGGCDCARPIIYAKKNKVKVDLFVVFTDRETWRGKTSPLEALRQYRSSLKIPARLVVVFLNPDNTTRSKRLTGVPDRGILEIYGFSGSMVQSMINFAIYPY